jgi:hypothetical protein
VCGDWKINKRRSATTRRFATFAARTPHLDRIGKELRVEIKANGRNVPRLFAAEQVARTANLEIRERQLESGAKVRRIEDRLETLARIIGERLFPSIEQIAPGATTAAADATAQLIELCEAEAIGTVEEVALRYTRLRDMSGVVWYVRNGEILRVANRSQGWTLAIVSDNETSIASVDPSRDLKKTWQVRRGARRAGSAEGGAAGATALRPAARARSAEGGAAEAAPSMTAARARSVEGCLA